MASIQSHTFATSDEQYELYLLEAIEESIQSSKEEESILQAIKESLQNAEEEALIKKLDDDALQCAIQESLQLSECDKKQPSLLARRGLPPLAFIPKKSESIIKFSVKIIADTIF
jgi:hypothetical protein